MENFSIYLKEQGIVACDSVMVKLYRDALSIAPTDANILIVGDSGTGKDCLAKFIHHHSPRSSAPFIHVNCSAIPDELFESEFFGYASGAFTGGSSAGRQGLVVQAAGGTLFLDEIGELPLALQTKLLQVVQEHSVRSIGATQDTEVNIRIIAATNQDLSRMVKEGAFRLDLYYRLNVVTFELPPLSRRKQDIKGFVDYLSGQFQTIYGCSKTFTPQAMEFLTEQEWVGNIREIQNFMEKLYVLEEASVITDTLLKENYRFSHRDTPDVSQPPKYKPLKQAVADFEKQYITEVLNHYHNPDHAAGILEIDKRTMNQKLKE